MAKQPYNRLSEVTVLGPEYQKSLRSPHPSLGWQGDPDLTIAYHHLTGWEVLREEASPDGREVRHVVIARQGPGAPTRFDINSLIRGLVVRDTRVAQQSHEKAVSKYLDEVAKEEAEKERRMFEAIAPVHEKLAWQTAKETGNLAPVVGLAGLDLPRKDAVDSNDGL